MDIITYLENKYPVDDIEIIDGTKIWNLLRVILYTYKDNKVIINKEQKLGFKNIIKLGISSLKPIRLPKMKYCAFSDPESRRLVNGEYYDIYVDYLYDKLDDYYIIEWPSREGKRYKNIYSKNIVRMKIPLSVMFKGNYISVYCDYILDELLKEFASIQDVDYYKLVKYINNSVGVFYHLKKYIKRLFKKYRPEKVFIRCAYGRFPMAVTQACHELDIPVVEIQHGAIWEGYIPYTKATQSINKDCIPDYIYTWGDKYSKIIKNGGLFNKENVINVGFPFLENDDSTPSGDLKEFIDRYDKLVLVSGQVSCRDLLKKYIKQIPNNIGVIYKPHPRDLMKYIFYQDNVFLMDKESNIYEAMKNVHIHCSVYSTTLVEAEYFGIPNIIIDNGENREIVRIDNKNNFKVTDVDEFIDVINQIL